MAGGEGYGGVPGVTHLARWWGPPAFQGLAIPSPSSRKGLLALQAKASGAPLDSGQEGVN